MSITTHTQYGKATGVGFTVWVTPITQEQEDDIRDTINSEHGGLHVSKYGDGWWVKIADDSDIQNESFASLPAIVDQLYTLAFEHGWVDREGEYFTLDLGQFDPWNLGYCVQIAAFGEEIVG